MLMERPWFEEFASEEDWIYEESVKKIRDGVLRNSLTFDSAASLLDLKDPELKAAIMEDALKVLIAEMHFIGKEPLKDAASALGLPVEKLQRAKNEMLKDIEEDAIEQYKSSLGQSGNA